MAKQTTMITNEVANPFRDTGEMCAKLNIEQSKYGLGWRLVDYKLGAICGLPLSRGRICASDGLSCVIITEQGFYIGHHAWFEEERQTSDIVTIKISSAKETVSKVSAKKQAIINELNNLLDL